MHKVVTILCGISDMFLKKIIPYFLRSFLLPAEESSDIFYQFFLVPRPLSAQGIRFHVLVQQLIRIQFRTISGQVKDRERTPVLGNPSANTPGTMRRVTVDNQEYLPVVLLLNQPTHEIDEHPTVELGLIHHKRQMAFVGNRRNHIATESLSRPRNYRRLAFFRIRPAKRMVRTQARLVPPEYRPSLGFGTIFYPRIPFFHPAGDFLRIPFVGSAYRLLRRKSPFRQIAAGCPDRQGNSESLLNEHGNRFPGPKHKRQLYLVGTAIRNGTHNLGRLPWLQASTPRTTTRIGKQSFRPFRLVRSNLFLHGFPSNTKYDGHFAAGFPIQNSLDGLAANVHLCSGRKGAEVLRPHTYNIV